MPAGGVGASTFANDGRCRKANSFAIRAGADVPRLAGIVGVAVIKKSTAFNSVAIFAAWLVAMLRESAWTDMLWIVAPSRSKKPT